MFCETFYQFPRPSKIVRDGTRPGRAWHNTRVQVKNVPSTNFGRTERHRQTACQVKPRNDSAPHTQNFFSCWVLIPKFSLRPTFQAVPDSGQCVGRGDGWCGGSEGDLYTYSEQLSKLRLNRLSESSACCCTWTDKTTVWLLNRGFTEFFESQVFGFPPLTRHDSRAGAS